MAAVVASIPNSVLGGAGVAMFGMVIASGIRALSKVKFDGTYNLMIVAISIGVSMITTTAPNFSTASRRGRTSSCTVALPWGSITAVVLNLILNGGDRKMM